MKHFFTILSVLFSTAIFAQGTFHQFSAETISGDTIDMSQYWGKKLMIVNTASYCGYTPQFEDLQALYEQYQQFNFEIIGFPCNNFGNQDPGDDSTILDFCTSNYGVTFQMMHKVDIVSGDTAPVYKWLMTGEMNGLQNAAVTWNFHKFLIDEAGHWVAHYASATNPLASAITNWIMSPSVLPGNEAPLQQIADAPNTAEEISTNISSLISGGNENAGVTIYTIDGRLIENISTKSFEVSLLSTLQQGVYIVAIQTSRSLKTFKYAVIK
jgi:glutathione peroxidase